MLMIMLVLTECLCLCLCLLTAFHTPRVGRFACPLRFSSQGSQDDSPHHFSTSIKQIKPHHQSLLSCVTFVASCGCVRCIQCAVLTEAPPGRSSSSQMRPWTLPPGKSRSAFNMGLQWLLTLGGAQQNFLRCVTELHPNFQLMCSTMSL